MDLHLVGLSGKVLIPADNAEAAKTVADGIAESLRVELESMIGGEQRSALSGTIHAGRVEQMPMSKATLQRMTAQLEMGIEE